MKLIKAIFYLFFILAVVKQALGEKILYTVSKSVGLQDSFTKPIFQNIDLFFVLGCAILFYGVFDRLFQGGRR